MKKIFGQFENCLYFCGAFERETDAVNKVTVTDVK